MALVNTERKQQCIIAASILGRSTLPKKIRPSVELTIAKQRKRRKRRKKRLLKKRLRDQMRREVRSARMVFPECDATGARETLSTDTMQADAFWKNYAMAQEWQKRQSMVWWKSRCVALEHENTVLRDKLRSLARRCDCRDARMDIHQDNDGDQDGNAGLGASDEDLEFNVTEDVLSFFETSERHKREMWQKHVCNGAAQKEEEEETPFVGAAESARMRKQGADLLYGDAGSEILAMETALRCTVERYEDTANPQYWPNIPLKGP